MCAAVTRAPGSLRPLVHAGTGLAALLLGVLPPWAAIAAAVVGVLTGWVLFPLTGIDRHLRRPGEPFLGGLRTYPLAVLGLVLALRPAEAAAAWGVLAFGDAAAAMVGTAVPAPSVFGHAKATWSGTTAHLLVGGVGAWGLGQGVAALAAAQGTIDPGPVPTALACFLAAGAAVLADLVLRLPDDNLSGAAAAGGALVAARRLLV